MVELVVRIVEGMDTLRAPLGCKPSPFGLWRRSGWGSYIEAGARVVIASDDHCPPHVHAHHKEEGWVVRIWFSFLTDAVGIMDIAPSACAVRQRQLNHMLDEVAAHLNTCREIWWEGKGTTRLQNKWLVHVKSDALAAVNAQQLGARQVRLAQYDALARTTTLIFGDGTEGEFRAESNMTEHNISDAEYEAALEAGRRAAQNEFRAHSVAYLPDRDALEVMIGPSGGFVVPRASIAALAQVDRGALDRLELWPDGSVIEIDDLDIHISVDGMVRAALRCLVPPRVLGGMFAAAGGATKSESKSASSRNNGKKGGRPRKVAA